MSFSYRMMRVLQLLTALMLACGDSVAASAQQESQPSPIGDWKLTAIYDNSRMDVFEILGEISRKVCCRLAQAVLSACRFSAGTGLNPKPFQPTRLVQ